MPEVGPRYGRFRIYVRSRDHQPPHVHVEGKGGRATVNIGPGWVEVKRRKNMSDGDANRVACLVAERLELCLEIWKRFHP
jgi:hypothetical protein